MLRAVLRARRSIVINTLRAERSLETRFSGGPTLSRPTPRYTARPRAQAKHTENVRGAESGASLLSMGGRRRNEGESFLPTLHSRRGPGQRDSRSEEHTSELQSL